MNWKLSTDLATITNTTSHWWRLLPKEILLHILDISISSLLVRGFKQIHKQRKEVFNFHYYRAGKESSSYNYQLTHTRFPQGRTHSVTPGTCLAPNILIKSNCFHYHSRVQALFNVSFYFPRHFIVYIFCYLFNSKNSFDIPLLNF